MLNQTMFLSYCHPTGLKDNTVPYKSHTSGGFHQVSSGWRDGNTGRNRWGSKGSVEAKCDEL